MACVPAPSCKAALAEATRLWPNRRRTSDGICSSPKHQQQNPNSDHDYGEAWDLSHDPANGCDCNTVVLRIVQRRDPRVKYVIWDRTIWRSYDKPGLPAWTPQRYTGSNPHTQHCHVSINRPARNDTAPWLAAPPVPAPPPPPPPSDPPEDLLMAVSLDIEDARRAQVREWMHQFWGRGPESVQELENYVWFLRHEGADKCLYLITDDPKGLAFAAGRRSAYGQ